MDPGLVSRMAHLKKDITERLEEARAKLKREQALDS